MSEADRVFPARKGQETKAHTAEKRFILSPSRRGGPAGGKGRVVEVVHVRRDGAKPAQARPRPAPWSVRAETWPEGFCAKTPSPPQPPTIEPVAPEPASPIVHAMPVWEPPLSKSALPATMAHELPVETAPPSGAGHALRRPKAPKVAVRRFADPFAGSDDGTNCRRCGYLVEPAREKRGLLTCSTCG
jgi:hypothetical protein